VKRQVLLVSLLLFVYYNEAAGTVNIVINLFSIIVKRQVLLVSLLIFVYYSEAAGTLSIDINIFLLQ